MNDSDAVWKSAENAVVAGDVTSLARLLHEHEVLFREQPPVSSWLGGLAPDYSSADARTILAREHYFANWTEVSQHLEALRRAESPVGRFEAAVDAVVAGDVASLKRLLRQNPELIHTRSTRKHRATLLHYVGANGVESWRQRTPPNAVEVAGILLEAGAEVDAIADMYGGATPLGLVATSIHPLRAGVQNALVETLLNNGAAMDQPGSAGNGQGIVNGCLANGRPGAAVYLANRGAPLDLEGAAGVGRLDVVRGYFDEECRLKDSASLAQLKSGFQWACEYGWTHVVIFLLENGIEVGEMHRGQTGLHWAAYGGHEDIVRRLLERRAPVDLKDERWRSTPLGWALHGWAHSPEENLARYHEVVALLVAAGSRVEMESISKEKLRADPRMLAALRGELPAG